MMRSVAFLWLALVILAGGYLVVRVGQGAFLQTDLLSLLPREEQNVALQKANDAVTGTLSHRIVILVGHKDRSSARKAATEIAHQLSNSGLVDIASNTFDKDRLRQIGTFYYPYRSGLLSDEDRDRLQSGRAKEIADRAVSQVYGIFGMANAKLLHGDPFLLLPNFLADLPLPLSRLSLDDGLLSVQDDGVTWVLVSGQLKSEPFSLDVQNRISDVFHKAAKSQNSVFPGLKVLHLGAVFFAKAAAEEAMNETSAIAIASILGTIFLVLAVFRAVRPLFLSLLVIGTGIMVALSATLWVFGELHVGALLFGVSLIGVAVDYSLQYCTEVFSTHQSLPQQRLKHVFAGITIGTATTVIGYLTLYLAPFPGLHQIAAFSTIGLVAAWITVVLWLPILDRKKTAAHGKRLLTASSQFLAFWSMPRFRRKRIVLLCLCSIAGFVGFLRFQTDDNVHHMQSLSASLVTEQEQIQKIIGVTGYGPFFLVQAQDDETALQHEETLVKKLRPLVTSGDMTGFQSPAQYVPSAARQIENRNLQTKRLYQPLLAKQTERIGLTETPIVPSQNAPILTIPEADKSDSPLAFLPTLLLGNISGNATHIMMLDNVIHPELLIESTAGIPGVHLVNPAQDFSNLLGKYRDRAIVLLALSAFLMAPLLIWRYGLHKGLWVMVPPAMAVILAPALRCLIGGTFTFFDAMALVLIFSIGVDYAVFCAETSDDRKSVTMLAVAMAACAALMSFGFLALSNVLAVHNFGATMTIGILLSFLFAPLARLSNKDGRSLSLRHILSIAVIFFLCGCGGQNNLSGQTTPQIVGVAPDLNLAMPNLESLGRSVEATQLVTAHYDHQDFVFEAHISASPEHFMLTGLDMMGQKLFSITWTNNGIEYEKASWVPSQLRPENILADIVLLYWPDAIVQTAISGSHAKLVKTPDSRSVLLNGKKIWYANYNPAIKNDFWDGRLHYRNLARKYEFDVQSTETSD